MPSLASAPALCRERRLVERSSRLIAWMVFDVLLNLPSYCVEVEARRRLHWWVLDGRLGQSGDLLLTQHEPPEFAAHEIIHVASASVVQALAANCRRSLERILADIDNGRHVG